MEKDAIILVGENKIQSGSSFTKDQKAVGTVGEHSSLVNNIIFIDDEDILDFFPGDNKDLLDEEMLERAAQVKERAKKMKGRNS